MMNTKKGVLKNFIFGLTSQAIILILGIVVPRVVLTNYGSDTNGLLNTITQVFMYMALLESGISQAATNCLYKPIKENNKDDISCIASLAKKQYGKMTIIYSFAVLVLATILPILMKTSVPYLTVFLVVFFEGATNVVSFYFVNTWTCVLNAFGKNYINSAFNFVARILCYSAKIVLSLFGVNVAAVQFAYFLISLAKLLLYYLYFKKRFGWVRLNVHVDNRKLLYKNDYLVTEIASVIFQSTDMIVLSIFVSTSASSVYSVYNLVTTSLSTLLNGAYVSLIYILNNAYIADIERYKKMHDTFNSFFVGSITVLMCVSYLLITPFVRLYTDGVTDISYINQWYPLLFCLIPLLSWCRYPQTNLAGISGNARKMAVCSIIEAAVNVVFSIILVNFLGIAGVLIATVIALPIKVFYLNYLSEKTILKRNPFKTTIILTSNIAVFFLTALASHFVGELAIYNYYDFVRYGFALVCIYGLAVFSLNVLINKDLLRFIGKISIGRRNF